MTRSSRFPLPALLLLLFSARRAAGQPGGEWAPSPSPDIPWAAPAAAPRTVAAGELPAFLRAPGAKISLAQAIDIALRNGPATREAWMNARAAAAALGARRSAYYPEINATVGATQQEFVGNGGSFKKIQTTYGPSLSLNWLLLDFGGRGAAIDQAKAALKAADFTHNAVIQDTIYGVSQAYYSYENAKALRDAAQSAFTAAQRNLDSAEARRHAGVSTIADVLQARTERAQAQLNLETQEGRIATLRGSLLATLGLPATLEVDAEDLPASVPAGEVNGAVEGYLSDALNGRPDLAAAHAVTEKAEARVHESRAAGLPSLNLAGTTGRTFYYNPADPFTNSYSMGLALKIPLFSGGRNHYESAQALAEAGAARARESALESRISFQVFDAYYGLKTATRQLETSGELLHSATQSEEVALGRYQAGAGSFLELLNAQRALAAAQAQEVSARSGWLLAAARLAQTTGRLTPPSVAPK